MHSRHALQRWIGLEITTTASASQFRLIKNQFRIRNPSFLIDEVGV